MDELKRNILKKIIWDYNISEEEIYRCLNGIAEKAGFYSKNDIIIKMLEHLCWYEIIKIIKLNELKKYLSKENIERIYPKSLSEKYEKLRKLLSGETLPASGWDSKDYKYTAYPILSDRWYSVKQRLF